MTMTQLLEQAIERVRQLPAEEQDVWARRILDELRDEESWNEAFARTTDEQWDRMAAWVRSEIAAEQIARRKP